MSDIIEFANLYAGVVFLQVIRMHQPGSATIESSPEVNHVEGHVTSPGDLVPNCIEIQCNLDYPDPFVHRLIVAIPDK